MNTFNPSPNRYNKSNYYEVFKPITPEFYEQDDINFSGLGVDNIDQVINSQILLARNIVTPAGALVIPSYDSISSLSQFFVKQNELTKITPQSFEDKILYPLGSSLNQFKGGSSLDQFETAEDFVNFLSAVLFPKLRFNQNNPSLQGSTGGVFGSNGVVTRDYLVDNLGMFAFLITSSLPGVGSYQASSFALAQLSSLYLNNTLETLEAVKTITKYVWYNQGNANLSSIIRSVGMIPTDFLSGTGTYTSGTQQWDKLETLLEIIYSKAYMDRADFRVKDAFDSYIGAASLQNNLTSKGPYTKLLKAIGYSMADINNQIQALESLYDIDTCPDEYLPYLAQLINWELMGPDPVKWRHQIRSAVSIYKRKGTALSIQYALNALIKGQTLDVSSNIAEVWESYIPFMLWYALATESIHFKNFETWTREKAYSVGIFNYDETSLENNIKIAVDYILLEAYKKFPNSFVYQGDYFPAYRYMKLDEAGVPDDIYCFVTEPQTKPLFFSADYRSTYNYFNVASNRENLPFENAFHEGPSGLGLYVSTKDLGPEDRPIYLSSTGASSFVFNFRGHRNFPLPPFEEIKYYKDCDITDEVKNFFIEKLKCLGVGNTFSEYFGSYLTSATIGSTDRFSYKNNFLMFFSSMQNPQNYFTVLGDTDRVDNGIFSLWNGKSSHIFVNFNASSFNFLSRDYTGNGKYAIQASRGVLNKFLPAHAIPAISLLANENEDPNVVLHTEYDSINPNERNTMYSLASGVFAGREVSGLDMRNVSPGNSNGRGGLNTFQRTDVDSVTDALVSSTSYITVTPRKSLRRRNFKFVLPNETYYDRTGFNQPITFDASVLERSMTSSIGFLPLGYIPSAGGFYPIADYRQPSGVWAACENLSSTNIFSGVYTSSTFPSRGLKELGSNLKYPEIADAHDKYVDRGQVHPIYIVMHKMKEKEALAKAQIAISATTGDYYGSIYNTDEELSLANTYLNSGTVGITNYRDYENFSFGRGLNELFRDYKKYFNHSLGGSSIEKTGGNIFAHTFGKGLFNCDFSIEGSAVSSQEGRYIASSIDTIVPIGYGEGSGVFTVCAVSNGYASGTYVASTVGAIVLPMNGSFSAGNRSAEFRNPYILSGLEFVQTSGASNRNKFEIVKLSPTNFVRDPDAYANDKTFIRCFTYNGTPRLRFDLSSYGPTTNTLIKNHRFKFSLKGQVSDLRFQEYGGGRVGVWIHTGLTQGPDGNYYLWSWTKRNRWELIKYNSLTASIVKNELAKDYTFKAPTRVSVDPTLGTQLQCIGNEVIEVDSEVQSNKDPLTELKEEYLETFEFEFDTRNYTNYNNYEYLEIIPIPDIYHQARSKVHDNDINYFVEVFYYPTNDENKYLLIDTISLQDLTLKQNSGIGTGYGIQSSSIPLYPFVEEFRYFTDKEELRTILKFMNGLTTDAYTSRKASDSSGILDTSGGTRLNYKLHPSLVGGTGGGGQVISLDIRN